MRDASAAGISWWAAAASPLIHSAAPAVQTGLFAEVVLDRPLEQIYTYAVGRPVEKGETPWMKSLETSFAKDGYRLPELMRRIATGDAMYRITETIGQTAAADPADGIRKEQR